MKKFKHLTLLLLATVMVFGCSKYDDTELKNDVNDIKSRVSKLEAWVKTANSDISALQELVTSLQNNDYVKGVTPVMEDGKEVGYTLTFTKGSPITVNHGKDGGGTKGDAPIIGVDKDANGLYYWTIKTGNAGATWLLDGDGNKIPTTGEKGRAPALSIDTEAGHHYWKVDGKWLLLPDGRKAPATGEQGDSFFENVTPDAEKGHVVFKLKGGKEFTLPMSSTTVSFEDYTPLEISTLNTETKVIVKLPGTLKKADFAAIKADITNVAGTSTAITRSQASTEPQKWKVTLTAPTFKADGTLDLQPVVTVTVPTGAKDGETALLKVTVVDTKGKEDSATRALFCSNKAETYNDGDWIQIQAHTKGTGLEIMIMGDGFTKEDLAKGVGKYETTARRATEYFFSIEPLSSYREYFSVYMIAAESEESGASSKEPLTEVKNKFGSTLEGGGSTLIEWNLALCAQQIKKAFPKYVTRWTKEEDKYIRKEILGILLLNSDEYAGTATQYTNGYSMVACTIEDDSFEELIHHEAGGHGFGLFADEYVMSEEPISDAAKAEIKKFIEINPDFNQNVDSTSDLTIIKWKDFIEHPKYPYVGAHEGAATFRYGIWRSEILSVMDYNIPYFSAQCRYAVIKRIKKLAGEGTISFDDFVAQDNVLPPAFAETRSIRPYRKSLLKDCTRVIMVD